MDKEKVLIMTFDIESKSYQAFSDIKRLHLHKKLIGEQMAVISHVSDETNPFDIREFIDFTGKNHTSKDGFIGMVLGMFAGPWGLMLGWLTGNIVGGRKDMKEIKEATTIFEHLMEKIDIGETGLLLIAKEEDNRPLNQLISYDLGGHITRLSLNEVKEDLKQIQEQHTPK